MAIFTQNSVYFLPNWRFVSKVASALILTLKGQEFIFKGSD